MTRIRTRDLIAIGLEPGPASGVAFSALPRAIKRLGRDEVLAELRSVVADPAAHTGHAYFAKVAEKLIGARGALPVAFAERAEPALFQSWCGAAQTDLVDVVAHFTPRIAAAGERPEGR